MFSVLEYAFKTDKLQNVTVGFTLLSSIWIFKKFETYTFESSKFYALIASISLSQMIVEWQIECFVVILWK